MKDATIEFELLRAAEAWDLYKGRNYWERYFQEAGLWPSCLGYDAVSLKYSHHIDYLFPSFQLIAVAKSDRAQVMGIGHSVPLSVNEVTGLSEDGWDWAVQSSILGANKQVAPNALCGLSITVLPRFQHFGIGTAFIAEMRTIALELGWSKLIVPVRPLTKSLRPFQSMRAFLEDVRPDGLHRDPWIRAHQRIGGRIVSICRRSMKVCLPVEEWRQWMASPVQRSGMHTLKGCLAPIAFDLRRGLGFYREPNVWMVHDVQRQGNNLWPTLRFGSSC